MKTKKAFKSIVIIAVLFLFVVFIVFLCKEPTYGKVKKILENDSEVLREINNLLLDDNNSYVSWNVYEKDMITYGPNMIDVQKNTVEGDFLVLLEKLGTKRYLFINKYNNYIEYRLWTNMTTCVSLIYSPDSVPNIYKSEYDTVFELKRIDTTDWYYHRLITEM